MKTKTVLLVAALVAFTKVLMMSCVGCASTEKRQYIDSLINVAGDSSYTSEQRLEAMSLLLDDERYLKKEDIAKMAEINEQMREQFEAEKASDSLAIETSSDVTRGGSERE